jgi:hypothetical protein
VLVRGTGQRSELHITVVDVKFDNWPAIRQTSPMNAPAREGLEYVTLTIRVSYASGPRDLPVSVDRFDFTVLDSNDVLHTAAFVVEPQPLISMTVYPGSTVTGSVSYLMPRDDRDPVLVWRYNDDRPVWFAIK